MAAEDATEQKKLERAYLEEIRDEQLLRMRWGIAAACGFAVLLLAVNSSAFAGADLARLRTAELGALIALCTAYVCTHVRSAGEHVVLLLGSLSACIACAVGFGAVASGGYGSHILYVIMLIWIFGAAITHLSVRQFIQVTWFDLPCAFAIIHWELRRTQGIVAPLIIFGGAYVYCLVGTFLRFRGELDAYTDRRQLAAAKRALEANDAQLRTLNDELGQRVDAQVNEIVQRAREVDLLNAQLKERVRERSRELVQALRRLGEAPSLLNTPALGTRIGERFQLVELLGEGGMGSVYLGRDEQTGNTVAIKTIRHTGKDARALQRLLLEATSAASVSHPGIIRTLDVDVTADGTLYLILEYVEGMALDRRLEFGPLPYAHACRIGAAIADALSAVHAGGVVHRDVKPSNVLLCRHEPGIKLLDFGIAKVLGDSEHSDTQVPLTQTNQVLGTPTYLAPEQAFTPEAVGPAADVYALAMIVFEMASGHLPFEATSAIHWLALKTSANPRELQEYLPHAPRELCSLLAQALLKDPARRPSACALRDALTVIADRERAPEATQLAKSRRNSAPPLRAHSA